VNGAVTVVVACDMPYVSSQLIAYMASLAADADAVVPQTEDDYRSEGHPQLHPQLHPLCAAYTQRCLDPIARRLAAGQLRMTDLLAELLAAPLADKGLRVVTTPELERFGDPHRLLANVNTPTEYESLDCGLPGGLPRRLPAALAGPPLVRHLGRNFDTLKSQEL
jgi:molybdopterin-guanine dinucleotide biosynthesis protein A